jgi:hypothetical protein
MVIGLYQRLIAPGPSAGVPSQVVDEHIARAAAPMRAWMWVAQIRIAKCGGRAAEADLVKSGGLHAI